MNKLVVFLFLLSATLNAEADTWSQFRGPNGSGVSVEEKPLPDSIGPDRNQRWVVDLPHGVSSPVVSGELIFLTGIREPSKLVTLAVRISNGTIAWESEAPINALEQTDKKPPGRLATATSVTDGETVISFFGSSGLTGYDASSGEQLWHHKMGPYNNRRGATTSPIIVGDCVILAQDHEEDSFCAAWNVKTGEPVWRTDRMLFSRSYVSPVVWQLQDREPLLGLIGSGLATFYDLETGRPVWFTQGTAAVPNAHPVIGDGRIYVAGNNPGPKREFQLSHSELVEKLDQNGDQAIQKDELPNGLFSLLFKANDDDDGLLSAEEYDAIQKVMGTGKNGMIAITPDGEGLDRTSTNVAWSLSRSTPRIASPVFYEGHLYMVKDGGVFQSVDAATGEIVKIDRIPASGKFFSSLVLGDGKIYVADDRGELCVIKAQPEWEVLSNSSFEETIYPTPAISGGAIYLRTETRLYCFSE
ncbi:MAG: PQQ-binding-like beta-propeller repeat protein [Verrucomicrobiota bacterium]